MSNYDLEYTGQAVDRILDTGYDLQNNGYMFRGVSNDYFGTPTEKVWLIAGEGSTGHGFTNPVPKGCIGICMFNGSSWSTKTVEVVVMESPTNGSTNAAQSGAVYTLVTEINSKLSSLTLEDTTSQDDEASQMVASLKMTTSGTQSILTSLTILAATVEKAGLLSAADKAKLDAILTNIRSMVVVDTTAQADEGDEITETLKWTVNGAQEVISAFTILAATSSKAGLMSAADKAKLTALASEGYLYAGVATPSGTPAATTGKVFYLAIEAGTYTDYGGIVLPHGINTILYDGSWSFDTLVGFDDEPTGGNHKLVESGGVMQTINSYQDATAKITEQTRLANIDYIDDAYINSDGNVVSIDAGVDYKYISLYKLPIADLQRIELADIKASGSSRLILYDSSGDIVYNNNCSTSLYVIDNSAGLYHFLSVGTNIIPAKMEITVTPFAIDIDTYPTDIVCPVPIPDDLKNSRLLLDNVYYGEASGYHSVSGLYIRNYQKLCFIPYHMNSDYQKIWLTETDGTVTSIDYPEDECITIDNTSGDYAYISYNARDGKPALYASGVASIDQEISDIRKNVSDCDANSHVATERFVNVVSEKDLIYDVYIDIFGRPIDIAPTQSSRYYSVMFFPVRKYDYFWVSGNTTTATYIKTYDSDLNEIGSTQGKNVMFDNSNHSISYISFTSRSSEGSLYINTQHEVSVRDAASMSIPSYVEIEPEWIDNKFINADNELASISQAETYHYKAVKDIFVKDATKSSWNLDFGGTARVVTSDIEGNIISVYTEDVNEIDNESGNVAFISICNNFVRNDIPILKLYKVPTIKEAVESLIKANSVSSPLSNKNIAVLGDSIMMIMSQGGVNEGEVTYVGTDDETYDISELTNIGGLLYVTSTLEDGEIVPTTIQADVHNSNQEVLDTESWIPLKDALNANHVINTGRGGATITGNAITTAYPAFGETSFNTMPNHCLELKRRVDAGEPTPDVIMMWAGTNDVRKFLSGNTWIEPTNFDEIMALDYTTQLLADTDSAMNYKKTFYGALRFCLEYLYRNFPNATVIFFSPIPSIVSPRTFERLRKVGGYIKNMAERYGALYVDACVEMGITDKLDTETNHVWLYDGLHPNAAGKVLYCNYTANKLNEIAFSKT